MVIENVKGEDYHVSYDPNSVTIYIQGELSLGGPSDYAPIAKLLENVADEKSPEITLDLSKLEFLNSSGISMLSKFVINMRKRKTSQIRVIGSRDIPWQGKSLLNLEKLFPGLKLELQ